MTYPVYMAMHPFGSFEMHECNVAKYVACNNGRGHNYEDGIIIAVHIVSKTL